MIGFLGYKEGNKRTNIVIPLQPFLGVLTINISYKIVLSDYEPPQVSIRYESIVRKR